MVPGAYGGPMDLSPKGVGYEGCPTTLPFQYSQKITKQTSVSRLSRCHVEVAKMVLTPIHPKLDNFSIETHGFGNPPF